VTECFGQLYSARKPQKSKKLGGHFGTRLVIILAISKNPDAIEVETEYIRDYQDLSLFNLLIYKDIS
jgi:hypothetical protein